MPVAVKVHVSSDGVPAAVVDVAAALVAAAHACMYMDFACALAAATDAAFVHVVVVAAAAAAVAFIISVATKSSHDVVDLNDIDLMAHTDANGDKEITPAEYAVCCICTRHVTLNSTPECVCFCAF